MSIIYKRCEGTGFIGLHHILHEECKQKPHNISETRFIFQHIAKSDVSVCDCCGDGNSWHGIPGEHYNKSDRMGSDGPYDYNGGLAECN